MYVTLKKFIAEAKEAIKDADKAIKDLNFKERHLVLNIDFNRSELEQATSDNPMDVDIDLMAERGIIKPVGEDGLFYLTKLGLEIARILGDDEQ